MKEQNSYKTLALQMMYTKKTLRQTERHRKLHNSFSSMALKPINILEEAFYSACKNDAILSYHWSIKMCT